MSLLRNISSRPRKMAATVCQTISSGQNVAVVDCVPIISGMRIPARTVVVIDNIQDCERQLRRIDPTITFIG